MESELLGVLRDKYGGNLSTLVEEKVFPVAGDICSEDLGIQNPDLKEQILGEVDIIINTAATITFDER